MDGVDAGRRQLCEARVGRREAAEGIRSRGDHGQAAAHVLVPVMGHRFAREHRLEAAGDRLDRRQRVVDLVADDSNQPLPRLPLLVAQRPAHVGEDQELMRPSFLPERSAPHFVAAGAAGKRRVGDARRGAVEARAQSERRRAAAEQFVRGLCQQPFARAVDEPQRLRSVEREDGDVDLDHHRA